MLDDREWCSPEAGELDNIIGPTIPGDETQSVNPAVGTYLVDLGRIGRQLADVAGHVGVQPRGFEEALVPIKQGVGIPAMRNPVLLAKPLAVRPGRRNHIARLDADRAHVGVQRLEELDEGAPRHGRVDQVGRVVAEHRGPQFARGIIVPQCRVPERTDTDARMCLAKLGEKLVHVRANVWFPDIQRHIRRCVRTCLFDRYTHT